MQKSRRKLPGQLVNECGKTPIGNNDTTHISYHYTRETDRKCPNHVSGPRGTGLRVKVCPWVKEAHKANAMPIHQKLKGLGKQSYHPRQSGGKKNSKNKNGQVDRGRIGLTIGKKPIGLGELFLSNRRKGRERPPRLEGKSEKKCPKQKSLKEKKKPPGKKIGNSVAIVKKRKKC